MEKQEIEKFVGIPYKFLGTDYTGVDCIGLCQLFLCEHGYNIEISSSSKIQDNVNPKTQKKDPKAKKVYNFGTVYADDK